MNPKDFASVVCPMCSAENRRGEARCFLCGQSLSGVTEAGPPKRLAGPSGVGLPSFKIVSLMLVIAVIAVLLGVYQQSPGIAVILLFPTAIALIRTLVVAERRPGAPPLLDHLVVFAATFAAVIGVAIAAGIAFFATCLAIVVTNAAGRGGMDGFAPGLVIGGIVGLAVMVGLTVVFVRQGRRSS